MGTDTWKPEPVIFEHEGRTDNCAGKHLGFEHVITRGIRKNRDKIFSIQLSGQDCYELLQFLQACAQCAEHYDDIRTAVLFENELRKQLRQQEF